MRLFILFLTVSTAVTAMNIDPYDEEQQYIWSENAGWMDMKANGYGVQVTSGKVTGFIWSGTIGWINLHPDAKDNAVGVRNDGKGNLSGLAWSENAGWIDFRPKVPNSKQDYGVTVDAEGRFSGWAWSENIGWINFNTREYKEYGARVCIVTLEDLAHFARQWLRRGFIYSSDFDRNYRVDMNDFVYFADWWQDYCPDGWGLK